MFACGVSVYLCAVACYKCNFVVIFEACVKVMIFGGVRRVFLKHSNRPLLPLTAIYTTATAAGTATDCFWCHSLCLSTKKLALLKFCAKMYHFPDSIPSGRVLFWSFMLALYTFYASLRGSLGICPSLLLLQWHPSCSAS